jgi:hypothetical protein
MNERDGHMIAEPTESVSVSPQGRAGRSKGLVAIAVTLAMLTAACGGSDDPVDASAGDDITGGSESVQVWADQLIAAVSALEATQSGISLGAEPAAASASAAAAVLGVQHDALDSLGATLPADPPSGDLLTSRYQAFTAGHAEVVAASSAIAANPEPETPWRFAAAWAKFERARDGWLESCFALQEVVTDNEFGVLGCVGLTGAEDQAQAVFDSIAQEPLEILSFVIPQDLGIDNELTIGPRRPQIRFDMCQPEQEEPKIDRIVDHLAASSLLEIKQEQGATSLEVWVFPDTASAQTVSDIVDRLLKTRRSCLEIIAGVRLIPNGANVDSQDTEMAALELGTGSGYVMTLYPDGGAPVTYQAAVAKQGNVVSLFSAATTGEPWEERVITELIGTGTISGSRPG